MTSKKILLVFILMFSLLLNACGPDGNLVGDLIASTTVTDGLVPAGETLTVHNGFEIVVLGELVVDGTIQTSDGPLRITIESEGRLIVNGTLRSLSAEDELTDDANNGGISILTLGELEFSPTAQVETNGHVFITDDFTELDRSPEEIAQETDSTSGDLSTLVPLPPEDPAFEESGGALPGNRVGLLAPAPQNLPTVTLSGNWDVGGFPGDQQIILIRFNFPANLALRDMQVSGPAAPDGEEEAVDPDEDGSGDAQGGDGKKGLRLNIQSSNGSVELENTILNLTDGGNGGPAFAICGTAEGGAGGESGNLRISAGVSISVRSVTINPGQAGHGGFANATCEEPGGDAIEALGGPGAHNSKRLFARGNVTIEELIIGPLFGGDGGSAEAFAANGDNGDICEDGQPGGWAFATGGPGGDASLNLSGLPVSVGEVRGGDGGNATAEAGNGGNGGDCPCGTTSGGFGGTAFAEAGLGGGASGGNPSTDGEDGTVNEGSGADGEGFNEVCQEDAIELGLQLFEAGDLPGALSAFLDAIQADPGNKIAHYNAGFIYYELADYSNALAAFREAIAIDPTYDQALYARALVGALLGESLEKQLSNWISFLEHHPQDDEFRAYANQQVASLRSALDAGGGHSDDAGDGGGSASAVGSFKHTNPGVSSEIYVDIQGAPGASVQASLSGPGVVSSASQSGTIGDDGKLRLTWTIDAFGSYTASGSIGGENFSVSVNVN